jgi:hypothetical protein
MTEFTSLHTDAARYEADYRRGQLTAAFAHRPQPDMAGRRRVWRRITLRSH